MALTDDPSTPDAAPEPEAAAPSKWQAARLAEQLTALDANVEQVRQDLRMQGIQLGLLVGQGALMMLVLWLIAKKIKLDELGPLMQGAKATS